MKQRISPCTTTILTFTYKSEDSIQEVYQEICKYLDIAENEDFLSEEEYLDLDGMVLEFKVDPSAMRSFKKVVPYDLKSNGMYYIKFRSFLLNNEPEENQKDQILRHYQNGIGIGE